MKKNIIAIATGIIVFLVLYGLLTAILPSIGLSDAIKGILKIVISVGGGIFANNFMHKRLSD